MINVTVIEASDDLERLVAEINAAEWDDENEMSPYGASALKTYLERQDTLFLACHRVDGDEQTFLGMASSRLEIKPYDEELWLYVDEVDVCANQRQQGAGKAMMQKLIELAHEMDCEEVWLGTEVENIAANALYKSLDPDDVGDVVGYTWELDD